MADNTAIEWTDATWNPITGCSVVSPGCTNCYAMKLAGGRLKTVASRKGLTRDGKAGPVWTGEVRFNEAELLKPLRWKRPRKIFVCAHGDLFHETVPDDWIDRVFAVMAIVAGRVRTAPHQFQVLTKRPARMRAYLSDPATPGRIGLAARAVQQAAGHRTLTVDAAAGFFRSEARWPLPNVWLGVSAEDQARADERIPDLLATPAAIRWLSAEPLLGPLWLGKTSPDGKTTHDWLTGDIGRMYSDGPDFDPGPKLDWVVLGGENGDRPMHPDWVRSILRQCEAARTPLLFKQWGSYRPTVWSDDGQTADVAPSRLVAVAVNGEVQRRPPFGLPASGGPAPRWATMSRVGKKAAGRLLDGVLHDAYPEALH